MLKEKKCRLRQTTLATKYQVWKVKFKRLMKNYKNYKVPIRLWKKTIRIYKVYTLNLRLKLDF